MPEMADSESLSRALRELEAAKARVERDSELVAREARKQLVAELLPVLDNVDRTIAAAEASGEAPSILEGARLVRYQLDAVLRSFGVERIDARGRRFDPAVHEAVDLVDVNDRLYDSIVIDQLEPGYRFGSTLLRPAKVIVGRISSLRQARIGS